MICRQLALQCISDVPGVENLNQLSERTSSKLRKKFLLKHEFRFGHIRTFRHRRNSIPIAPWVTQSHELPTILPAISLTDSFLSLNICITPKKQRDGVAVPGNSIELMDKSDVKTVARVNLQLFFLSVIAMVFPDYFFSYGPDRLSGFATTQPFSTPFNPKTF